MSDLEINFGAMELWLIEVKRLLQRLSDWNQSPVFVGVSGFCWYFLFSLSLSYQWTQKSKLFGICILAKRPISVLVEGYWLAIVVEQYFSRRLFKANMGMTIKSLHWMIAFNHTTSILESFSALSQEIIFI